MSIRKLLLTVALTGLVGTGSANAAIITNEDFTGGATGWTNNATSFIAGDQVLGGFNLFGVGVVTQKTFALSGNQTSLNISLDFWKGDSWDGESFIIEADGNLLYSQSYVFSQGSQVAGQSYSDWNELLVPISLNYATTATSMTLTLRSTLDQGPWDEWWAVDNVVITDNVPVPAPEPAIGLLMLSAFACFAAYRRRK